MSLIYLDWNIFNKLERISEIPPDEMPAYEYLFRLILDGDIVVPYSNAHINDLYRGYVKNPAFTPGHLENISHLTKQLCLTQYWDEKIARWHYRDPAGFLEQVIEESPPVNFRTLLYSDLAPETKSLWDAQCQLFENTPLPEKFREIFNIDPIFHSLFPRSEKNMNMLAMCEDILAFSNAIKTDYALYKSFRKYLTSMQHKFHQLAKTAAAAQETGGSPLYLTWDQLWEQATPKFKPLANAMYGQIVDLFTTTDLKGYRQDERFANLIDDALHAFYGAHCDYFLTLDKRCADKAVSVYKKLLIDTKVRDVTGFFTDYKK
jgi:hypothetical protein